jgi:hypothetical protein
MPKLKSYTKEDVNAMGHRELQLIADKLLDTFTHDQLKSLVLETTSSDSLKTLINY